MLRAYIFLTGAGAGAAAAAAFVLDFGAAAMGAAFAGLDAFALAGAFFAVFFGACGGFNVSRRVDGGEGVFKALIRAPGRTDFFLGAAFFFACENNG